MTQPLAKIFQPAKTAMQSGKARTKKWRLEYAPIAPMIPDALMGWNTMPNTLAEVSLSFATKDEAVAYATAKNIPFEVIEPHASHVAPKAYAENFSNAKRTAFDSGC